MNPIQRVAPIFSSAAAAACSTATVVFIRVLGEARRWLRSSRAAMPRAMRSVRAAASRSILADERTQTMR